MVVYVSVLIFNVFVQQQIGEIVEVDECNQKKCVLDDVTGKPEIELVQHECDDDNCNTDCVS